MDTWTLVIGIAVGVIALYVCVNYLIPCFLTPCSSLSVNMTEPKCPADAQCVDGVCFQPSNDIEINITPDSHNNTSPNNDNSANSEHEKLE